MTAKNFRPTDAELEILQVLWQNGPSTVRQVNEILNRTRETGYTTTLKLMQIMLEKELVVRDDAQRTHIYTAAAKESDTQQQLLRQFVDSTFRGSASRLVMQLLGNHSATPEELEQIKALIEKLENEDQ